MAPRPDEPAFNKNKPIFTNSPSNSLYEKTIWYLLLLLAMYDEQPLSSDMNLNSRIDIHLRLSLLASLFSSISLISLCGTIQKASPPCSESLNTSVLPYLPVDDAGDSTVARAAAIKAAPAFFLLGLVWGDDEASCNWWIKTLIVHFYLAVWSAAYYSAPQMVKRVISITSLIFCIVSKSPVPQNRALSAKPSCW